MSKILTVRNADLRFKRSSNESVAGRRGGRILNMEKNTKKENSFVRQGNAKLSLVGLIFILAMVVMFSGAVYLYEVNDLATKGYEVRELQGQIAELKKSNENYRIKEVEARSMYYIEASTKDSGLVSAVNPSYLTMNGPVAMK